MRKLMRAEYEDVVRGLSQPVVVTHVCLGEIADDEDAVKLAMDTRIAKARVPRAVYLAAAAKLAEINPAFDQAALPQPNLDQHGVPRGALVFTRDAAVVAPNAASPVSVVDQNGTTVPGRASVVIGDDDAADPEVLVRAQGFESFFSGAGWLRAFPDVFPFGVAGLDADRPVPMSWQSQASLMIRQHDRSVAKNQLFLLMLYSAIVRKEATGTAIGTVLQQAGADLATSPPLAVSRPELESAAAYHDARLAAVKDGKPMPARPVGLSIAAEQMLRSVRQSASSMPGTVEFALNKRNEMWALMTHFGVFSIWNTYAQNDATCHDVANISQGPWDDAPPALRSRPRDDVLRINAADPGACVMYYSELTKVFIRHILGWDSATQAAVPGGGVFGEVSCFAGMTEDQKRFALHLHSLVGLAGFPSTTEELVRLLRDPTNVRAVLNLLDVAQSQSHPCHGHEFTAVGELGHECFDVDRHVVPVQTAVLAEVLPLPAGYRTLTKCVKIKPPRIVRCRDCGELMTAQGLVLKWALANCGDEARDQWELGNKRLSGVKIDMAVLVGPPLPAADPAYPAWERENERERAKVTLVGVDLLEHAPGHFPGCFKATTSGAKSAARPTCRFALPAVACTEAAVLVNGRIVCSCVGGCRDAAHLIITADFTIDDVLTMELRTTRPPGFEYTNNHNVVELAVFRHNVDTTTTLGRPGMVYYVYVALALASLVRLCRDPDRSALSFPVAPSQTLTAPILAVAATVLSQHFLRRQTARHRCNDRGNHDGL
jgi:hypothetical protein